MAIIALRAWYLPEYEPLSEVKQRPHDLRLSKSSLLKSGLRADFLDERETVEAAEWFQRYLSGETVEFYIEGSGGYQIANIDVISQEIYFIKQEVSALLDPIIYFAYQEKYATAYEVLGEVLQEAIEGLNQKARVPLSLEFSVRPKDGPVRLSSSQLRKIRKSLIFVADGTPVAQIPSEETAMLLPSPTVSLELGYALQCKRREQILLMQMERWQGDYPFDLPNPQQLKFKGEKDLKATLPQMLEAMLERYHLQP
ncbi:MAG: hypothetical protein GVY17_06405 [Cyanobacteria bacterium]|jgi:hypothetical protein|nr:hypothetical protein [Cyanobacteria bacterium GSL.Bin21]